MTVEHLCPTEKRGQFRLINADITGMCNLRCRFCFNDFAKADRAFMSIEQFEAITALLDQVPDERFFVSCLYEPTLHPRFAELLSLLPNLGRKKAFFTTNLARVLEDATLLAISRANVAHINISIETLRPNIYQYLCGSKRFRLFYKNLELLARFRRGRCDIPPLRYITMVLRANYQELVSIVRVCKDKLGANEHELRTL